VWVVVAVTAPLGGGRLFIHHHHTISNIPMVVLMLIMVLPVTVSGQHSSQCIRRRTQDGNQIRTRPVLTDV
jgi:hypothetical protein